MIVDPNNYLSVIFTHEGTNSTQLTTRISGEFLPEKSFETKEDLEIYLKGVWQSYWMTAEIIKQNAKMNVPRLYKISTCYVNSEGRFPEIYNNREWDGKFYYEQH